MDTTHPKTQSARKHIAMLKSGTMAIALLCSAPAFAQDAAPEEDGVVRLGTIFVDTNGRADDDARSIVASEMWAGGKVATSLLDTPASVSVITEKELKDRNAATTEEVLQYSAGIHSDYYGTDDRNDYFLVRGFQATTFRDGLTLGSMRGVREEPLAFERVEVVRGSNSTLFGMGDPGGSVNFVTRQPKFERIADTTLGFDSLGGKEASFDFGNAIENTDLAFRLTGKLRDGKRDYDHSRDDARFLMAGLSWRPSDATTLSFIADYLKRDGTPNSGGYPLDREYDRSDFFGEPEFNDQNVERKSASLLLTHEFSQGLSLRANLRYSDLTDDYGYIYLSDFIGRPGTSVGRFNFGGDSTAEELIGNAVLQYDTKLGNVASSTLAGIEFRDAESRSASFFGADTPIDIANPVYTGRPGTLGYYSDTTTDYSAKSLFVTQNLSFNERLIVTAGLRRDFLDLTSTNNLTGDRTNGDFAETSGRLALTYKFTDEISGYASYVESVAPPSLGVEPERGEQYEVGVKYSPLAFNALFSASIYDLSKQNVTIAVVQPGGLIERETVGESRARGFDLEARAEISEALSLIGSYSYMETEIVRGAISRGVDLTGKEFTVAPRHSASIWTNYTLANAVAEKDVTLGLGLRYTGSYFFDAGNTRKSADALLVDASVAFDLSDSASMQLNVSNLFDEQHVVGSGTADYYNPGREVSLNLTKRW